MKDVWDWLRDGSPTPKLKFIAIWACGLFLVSMLLWWWWTGQVTEIVRTVQQGVTDEKITKVKVFYDGSVATLTGVVTGLVVDRMLRHREKIKRLPVKRLLETELITMSDRFLKDAHFNLAPGIDFSPRYIALGPNMYTYIEINLTDYPTMFLSKYYEFLKAAESLEYLDMALCEQTSKRAEEILLDYGFYLDVAEVTSLINLRKHLVGFLRKYSEIQDSRRKESDAEIADGDTRRARAAGEYDRSMCAKMIVEAWNDASGIHSRATQDKKPVSITEGFFGRPFVEEGEVLEALNRPGLVGWLARHPPLWRLWALTVRFFRRQTRQRLEPPKI